MTDWTFQFVTNIFTCSFHSDVVDLSMHNVGWWMISNFFRRQRWIVAVADSSKIYEFSCKIFVLKRIGSDSDWMKIILWKEDWQAVIHYWRFISKHFDPSGVKYFQYSISNTLKFCIYVYFFKDPDLKYFVQLFSAFVCFN